MTLMHTTMRTILPGFCALAAWMACCALAHAAQPLDASAAWIRAAPQGAMMLAGYAVLRNESDAAVVVHGVASELFDDVSLHETVEQGGMSRMRALGDVTVPAHGSVTFAPGGKHFMLMGPRKDLHDGDIVPMQIRMLDGKVYKVDFRVATQAP